MSVTTKAQECFINWLAAKGYANYSQINSMLHKLNESSPIDNPENRKLFDIVVRPLYATGMVEAVRKEYSIYYSLVKSEIHSNGKRYSFRGIFDHEYICDDSYDEQKDSQTRVIELLKKMPSISDIVNRWSTKVVDCETKFYERTQEGEISETVVYQANLSTNIYALSSKKWNKNFSICINNSNYVKKIPGIDENTEGMKIARCRIAQERNESLFGYDESQMKLYVRRSWDIPVPIMRLLFILNPEKLVTPETYTNNLIETSIFENITNDVVKEIGRIFSERCVSCGTSEGIVCSQNRGRDTNKFIENRFGKWGMYKALGELPDLRFGELIVDFKYSSIQDLFRKENLTQEQDSFDTRTNTHRTIIQNILPVYEIRPNGQIGNEIPRTSLEDAAWRPGR